MSSPLLVLENVHVRYERTLAVRDVSFALRGGELLGFVGANGAGKTSTLRAAAGLQPLASGRVRIMDMDVATHDVLIGYHIGFTPDTPAVYDGITVVEFLRFIGRAYNVTPAQTEERIDHWLEALWLSEKRDSKISTLSRGMRQRLAVARTLLPDPHVVLLDEPAAGLDPAGRVQFRRLLANLRDQGKAIIVSSHILADLAEYSTHIAIMERGRLKEFRRVSELAGDGGTRDRYSVVLAERIADIRPRLDAMPGLTVLEADGNALLLEFESGRPAAARLLSMLISAGLSVAEFAPRKVNLEEIYLRSGVKQVD